MTKQRLFPIVVLGWLRCWPRPLRSTWRAPRRRLLRRAEATAVVNGLGARLQPVLADQQADANSNLVFSPASIGIALTMTSAGANGDTLAQMHDVLRIDGSEIHDSMGALELRRSWAGPTGSFTLANSLWLQDGFRRRGRVRRNADGRLPTASRTARTSPAIPPARSTTSTDGWPTPRRTASPTCSPTGDITTLTRLVLANAVHLDADWASPFEAANTSPEVFDAR